MLHNELSEGLGFINPERIADALEIAIELDTIDLEVNTILNNLKECKEISDRICDSEVLVCFIRSGRFNRFG